MLPLTARAWRLLARRLRLGISINGRLVRPIDVSLRMANTYWIVCPEAASVLPKITAFREWLLAEAADDMRRLKTLRRNDVTTVSVA
jgi:DNA-binding transcriptional LysR family regulator